MLTVTVHIVNEDPIVCEMYEMPSSSDQFLMLHNPRRRDGKDIHYLDEDVTSMMIPWHRINFVQLMPSADVEEVIGFVRE